MFKLGLVRDHGACCLAILDIFAMPNMISVWIMSTLVLECIVTRKAIMTGDGVEAGLEQSCNRVSYPFSGRGGKCGISCR